MRVWQGWHHRISLALLFSASDITELLNFYLPAGQNSMVPSLLNNRWLVEQAILEVRIVWFELCHEAQTPILFEIRGLCS